MFDRRNVTAVLLAGVFAAGCGDGNGTTDPPVGGAPLSEAESVALFKAFEVFQNDSLAVEPTPGSNVDATAACPLGGQVRVTGTASTQTVGDTVRVAADLNVVPTACRLAPSGFEFTLDGAPGVRNRFSAALILSEFDVSIEGTSTGTLNWQLADRSGSCAIDLALSGASDPSNPVSPAAATWSGTLCGHTVEFDAESDTVLSG